FIAGKVVHSSSISVYDSGPLHLLIREILSRDFVLPTYVTVAREVRRYYDPDFVEAYATYYGGVETGKAVLSRSVYVPEYHRVDMMTRDQAREELVISAALPYGIAPPAINTSRQLLVDGGVADNIPIFPLIEMLPCTELVVVLCDRPKDEVSFRSLYL